MMASLFKKWVLYNFILKVCSTNYQAEQYLKRKNFKKGSAEELLKGIETVKIWSIFSPPKVTLSTQLIGQKTYETYPLRHAWNLLVK